MGKIVALDFGLKRTGIAITDELQIIASPLTTVDSKDLMAYLIDLVKKDMIDIIVLGLPKRLNNEQTHITENVYLLKDALVQSFPQLRIELLDERFTSKMAMQSMIDNGLSKKQRSNKGTVDMVSATIILQSYLSSSSF